MKYKIMVSVLIVAIIVSATFLAYRIIQRRQEDSVIFFVRGNKTTDIFLNTNYEDLGFVASLNSGEDLNKYVEVSSNVRSDVIGEYQVTYKLKYKLVRKKLTRNVTVSKDPLTDITLSLVGDDTIYLLKGMKYVEQGIVAKDIIDGDISSSLVIEDENYYQFIGNYQVKYTVTNSRGVSSSVIRNVVIYDFNYDLSMERINDQLKLTFNTDSYFVKGIMVNNEPEILGKTLTIDLIDNKEYSIKILDIYGNYSENYFDFLKPVVSCNADISLEGTSIKTVATDNKNITKYYYYIDDNKYESLENTYKTSIFPKTVNVEVYDENNNHTRSVCTIVDNVPYFDSGIKDGAFSGWKYSVYVPENIKMYSKSPLIVFLHGAGEHKDKYETIHNYALMKNVQAGKKYNGFILAPLLRNGQTWRGSNFRVLMRLIEEVKKTYNIDPKRIGISGFSMGAGDLADGIKENQNYFSSAVMIAPGYRGSVFSKYFVNVPTWVFYGSRDDYSNSGYTKAFIEELQKLGGEVHLTVYEGRGHNIIDTVFENDLVVNWMLSKKLP